MRTTFVWRRAMRLPTVIDAAESTHMRGSTTSGRPMKPTRISWRRATKPAVLEATEELVELWESGRESRDVAVIVGGSLEAVDLVSDRVFE